MKIIISPSKDMDRTIKINKDLKTTPMTDGIISMLEELQIEDIIKIYKVDKDWAIKIKEDIDNLKVKDQVTYRAIDLYKGLAYKHLKVEDFTSREFIYLDKYVKILSALYGPISPLDLIKPYRLDLTLPIKVNTKSLKSYWRDVLGSYFQEGELIINLASKEFSSLFDRKRYRVMDFDFFESTREGLKSHSTLSKKARGLMVRFMCKNNILNIEDLSGFNLDHFKFSESLSKKDKFVFVKEKL